MSGWCSGGFLCGIGIGVEYVTIDTYLSELVPVERRGKAFAFTSLIGTTAYPITAFLAWALVPATPLGVDGWRWGGIIAAVGAIVALVPAAGTAGIAAPGSPSTAAARRPTASPG